MSDTIEVTDEPTIDAGTFEALRVLLKDEREAAAEETRKAIDEAVDDMRTAPDRSNLERLNLGTTEHPIGQRSDLIVPQWMSHPTDPLYARYIRQHPEMALWRSHDQDALTVEWIRGVWKDNAVQFGAAFDKLRVLNDKITGFQRADILEGVLDVSDETAILSGTGASLLPQNFEQVVQINRDAVAVLEPLVMQLTMTSATVRVPTSGQAAAAMIAEGTPNTNADEPPFTSEMLIAHKAESQMVASEEEIADAAFNLISILGLRAGSALGALVDVQIATSNGTSPNLTEALSGGDVAEATTTVLIYEDLVTLFFALAQVYRTGAVWLAGTVVLKLLSQMLDSSGFPILTFPGFGMASPVGSGPAGVEETGQVGTIFGKRVYEAPFADGTLIFGNIAQGYGFARRSGIVAKSSTHSKFNAGLVEFLFNERYDGRLLDAVAIKQMTALATVA